MKRYRIGFEDGVKCDVIDEYPNLTPIVDTAIFGYGHLIAFALNKHDAESLVERLNTISDFEKTWTSLP